MCHFNVIFSKLGGSGKDSSHKIVLERKKKIPQSCLYSVTKTSFRAASDLSTAFENSTGKLTRTHLKINVIAS